MPWPGGIVAPRTDTADSVQLDLSDIRPSDVRAAIDRLIAAEAIRPNTRQARLLDYLVTAELKGGGGSIKAYSIGVDVLERGPDFDPSTDAIARVEVGRLRRALEEYYACAGARDPIRIEIPRGQLRLRLSRAHEEYDAARSGQCAADAAGFRRLRRSPSVSFAIILTAFAVTTSAVNLWSYFTRSDLDARFADTSRPIVEFGPYTSDLTDPQLFYLAAGIRAELLSRLSQLPTLRVRDAAAAAFHTRLPRADYTLTADFRPAAGGAVMNLSLTDSRTETLAWTGSISLQPADPEFETHTQNQVLQVVQWLASPTGLAPVLAE